MKELENIMLEELNKALDGNKHELKESIENLAKNFRLAMDKVAQYETENEEAIGQAEELAGTLLKMTQIFKDIHIWLGSVSDKFPTVDKEYTAYKDIIEVLGLFVMSSGAIKAGAIEHAKQQN